jgi:hypothetical protein
MAVCDKTYHLLTREPYAADMIAVPPHKEVSLPRARGFVCTGAACRDPRETKGRRYRKTVPATRSLCGPEGCC